MGDVPVRAAGGRGAGASREVKGLLPGRGPAGRGRGGMLEGRGASLGAEVDNSGGNEVIPMAAAAAVATAISSAVGPSANSAAFLAAAFLAGAFFAGAAGAAFALAASAGKASLTFLITGASMVEDAERTNSPISCSLATRTLLSMPNSLASS